MRKIVLFIATAALSLGGCGQPNITTKEQPAMQGDLFANESGDVVLVERRLTLQEAFIAEKWKPLSTTEHAIGECKGRTEWGSVVIFCKAEKEYRPAQSVPYLSQAVKVSFDAADAPKLVQEAIRQVNADAEPMVNPATGK
jgi:hypothetical protein